MRYVVRSSVSFLNETDAHEALIALASNPDAGLNAYGKEMVEKSYSLDEALAFYGWVRLKEHSLLTKWAGTVVKSDEEMFKAISPSIKNGSYIMMSDETGNSSYWEFDGKVFSEMDWLAAKNLKQTG